MENKLRHFRFPGTYSCFHLRCQQTPTCPGTLDPWHSRVTPLAAHTIVNYFVDSKHIKIQIDDTQRQQTGNGKKATKKVLAKFLL